MENDYKAVRESIKAILNKPDWPDFGFIGPLLLRLSWHASGTFFSCKTRLESLIQPYNFKKEHLTKLMALVAPTVQRNLLCHFRNVIN
jgi:catalase (peroxidase I)